MEPILLKKMDIILINNLIDYDLYMNDKHIAFNSNEVRNLDLKKIININFLLFIVSIGIVLGILISNNFYRTIPIILIPTFFSLYTKLLPMWSYSIKFKIGSELYTIITNKKEIYFDFLGIIKKNKL
ncbi:MAG: hypothetical protein ACOYBS_11945 [Flavobacterium sp.]